METSSKISQRGPQNDAQPSKQTADSEQKKTKTLDNVLFGMNKLIYQIVKNCVDYAGNQFGENLVFNSNTLSNVLYDNIRKLLGEKLNEQEFIEWLAKELVDKGVVGKTSPESTKIETVAAIDPNDYQELVDRITAAVTILKTRRNDIFKAFASDGNQEGENGQARQQSLDKLVKRIQDSQTSAGAYAGKMGESREAMNQRLTTIYERVDKFKTDQKTQIGGATKIIDSVSQSIGKIKQTKEEEDRQRQEILDRAKASSGKASKSLIGQGVGRTKKRKKPGILQKTKVGLKYKATRKWNNLKQTISNSTIGKTYKAIAMVLKKTWTVVKKVASTIKKAVQMAYRAVKTTVKGFIKASLAVGKGVVAAGRAVVSGVKLLAKNIKQKGFVKTILSFNPAAFVTKASWRAIKFTGKAIWKGIKKLAFKAWSFFAKMFGFVGRFVNKVSTWIGIIGRGIKDKAYRFIVKPIASMFTNVFHFVGGIVSGSIDFMKWAVSSILDRVMAAFHSISEAVGSVLNSTKSIFGKLLKNPLTWVVLIGALFFFFGKHIIGWANSFIGYVKETILPNLVSFAKKAWDFLKSLWDTITTIGGYIIQAVSWLTDPEGVVSKFIMFSVKTFLWLKKMIKKMVVASGKSSIDALCMLLAGDMIGLAIHAIKGGLKTIWNMIKNTPTMRIVMGMVNAVVTVGKLIGSWATVVWRSLANGVWQMVKGNFGGVIDAITAPWKDLWKQIKDVFSGRAFKQPDINNETLDSDPVEESSSIAINARSAVRGLDMKGTVQDNLAYFQKYQSMFSKNTVGNLGEKLKKMNALYQLNAQQVDAYNTFLERAWELGKDGPVGAQQIMKQLLESPELSQRLLSAFFYYNPQTGKTSMLRPQSYIGQFLDNIREMVSAPERDDEEAFRTIIEAFDQLNKERSYIINKQGRVLGDFAERIVKFNQKNNDVSTNGFGDIGDYIKKLNAGTLFTNADAMSSFKQIQEDDAKTKDLESITGSTLGTNKLLKVKEGENGPQGGGPKPADFDVPKPPPEKKDTVGNVILPPGSAGTPPVDQNPIDESNVVSEWQKYHNKRRELIAKGNTEQQAHELGYDNLTLEEFKERQKKLHEKAHPKTPEEIERERIQMEKRKSALRMDKMVQAYNQQGEQANADGFRVGGKPSILQVNTDNLTQTLFMFSPVWQKMQSSTNISEDDILLEIDKDDKAAQARIRKAKEEQDKKKAEEEKERKREQEILNYSAKVNDGFIEIKIGEDLTAMTDSYSVHMNKRREFIAAGHTEAECDKAGLFNYTWEEWKRYYRKMHGLPEDGIKRIPFNGQKKERQIDWSARYPMSIDELGKYGIKLSENGPVMIPLDKAMAAAGSILAGAKTIYAVRDGLEVMSQGIKSETNVLKERNKGGQQVGIVSTGGSSVGESTTPLPPESTPSEQVY